MFYELFSQKNTPYFVFIFGLVLVVLVIALFILQFMFQRKISTKSIDIVTRIETDAVTNDECVKMSIANTGFHSIEIRGFGFKHKNRDYDYLRTYKDERNIPVYQKIVISPRDSLETVIDLNDLKAKLNSKKIGKFRAYVIDVYGNYCLIKAKDVKAFVELYFKHVEYIEKVRNMPAEKQEKKLKQEKMYEERRKKILNHTIEDSFEKANIGGAPTETNNVLEEKVVQPEPIKEEIKEEVVEEAVVENTVETPEEEKVEASSDFVFNDLDFEDEDKEEDK